MVFFNGLNIEKFYICKVKLSIIIPVINEEKQLNSLLPYLNNFGGDHIHEIIVADGGSTDNSEKLANEYSAIFLKCTKKGRAFQMNEGAKYATGDVFYFLHADSLPPKGFSNDVKYAIESGCYSGCFKMSFDNRHFLLRFAGWLTRFNNSWCRGGDQSLYVTRDAFEKVQGYNESLIIYEDNEILSRLRKITCFCVIRKTLVTSARRFEQNGIFRLQMIFLMIHLRYRFGTSQDKLLAFYKRHVR